MFLEPPHPRPNVSCLVFCVFCVFGANKLLYCFVLYCTVLYCDKLPKGRYPSDKFPSETKLNSDELKYIKLS